MRSSFLFPVVAAVCALAASTPPTDPAAVAAAKIVQLRQAPTTVARLGILEDKEFTIDFSTLKPTTGSGGSLFASNVANFPALDGLGVSMTIGRLGACGLNTPHTHPRATELLYVVNGDFATGFLQENGAKFVMNNITTDQAAVFPIGSIHFQQNLGCEEAIFVAALNHEDPGALQIAQRFFGLDAEIVDAALGGLPDGVIEVLGLEDMIPDNVALGIASCLQKCGLQRGVQNTTQLQAPNPGEPANQPNNSLVNANSSTVNSSTVRNNSNVSRDAVTTHAFGALAEDATQVLSSDGVSKNVLIVLCAVVGAMALGYVAIGIYFFVDRRRRSSEKVNRYYVRPNMAGRSTIPLNESNFDEPRYDEPKYDS